MKTNHEGPRTNTNRPEDRWTCFNDTMLPRFCPLGGTISWDEGPLGARASRPHNAEAQPRPSPPLGSTRNGPWLSFGLAVAVHADRVAACKVALTLSDPERAIHKE